MSTIAEKLALLMNTKSDLKAALIEKGQSVSDGDAFAAYPGKTRAIKTGAQLPALANPGAASDLASGKQLIGPDGSVVTGTVEVTSGYGGRPYTPLFENKNGANYIGFQATAYNPASPGGLLMRSPYSIELWGLATDFGDATADDVVAGKTFTSAAGVKVAGTAKIANNEQVTFSVINNSSGTIWVESISPNDGSAGEQMVPSGGSCEVITLTGMFTVIGSHSDISLSVAEAFSVAAAVGFIPTASTASVTVTDV